MHVNAYLNFNGNCREAFEFYARCFGAKIVMMQTHGESPMAAKTPAHWKDAIVHARLEIGDTILMASDSPPEYYKPQQGFYVSLQLDDVKHADKIFQGLSENGKIEMPLGQTFWAERFGMVIDRFGIPWMVNCNLNE